MSGSTLFAFKEVSKVHGFSFGLNLLGAVFRVGVETFCNVRASSAVLLRKRLTLDRRDRKRLRQKVSVEFLGNQQDFVGPRWVTEMKEE